MALDISKLMAMRSDAEKYAPERDRQSDNMEQIKMFEEIEDGTACRCPACMGLIGGLSGVNGLYSVNPEEF